MSACERGMETHLLTWENLTSWLISFCHVLDEGGICALLCWNLFPYVSGYWTVLLSCCDPSKSISLGPTSAGGEGQLLQKIIRIRIFLNLLKRHRGKPVRRCWEGQLLKRRAKLYSWLIVLICQNSSGASRKLKQMRRTVCKCCFTTSCLELGDSISFLRLASISMSLLYSLPPCLTFWGCKCYTLLPVAEETDRHSESTTQKQSWFTGRSFWAKT